MLIAESDWPNNWNNLFPSIYSLIHNSDELIVQPALHTLSYLVNLLDSPGSNEILSVILPDLSNLLMNETSSISIRTKSLNVLTSLLISIYNHDQHKNEILSYLNEALPSISIYLIFFNLKIDWFNLLNNSLVNSTYIKETLSFYTSLFKFYGILASHYINVYI